MARKEDYNALFALLTQQKAWGTLVFVMKDGEVKKFSFQQDFLDVETALDRLNVTPDEEEPEGVIDEPRARPNRQSTFQRNRAA